MNNKPVAPTSQNQSRALVIQEQALLSIVRLLEQDGDEHGAGKQLRALVRLSSDQTTAFTNHLVSCRDAINNTIRMVNETPSYVGQGYTKLFWEHELIACDRLISSFIPGHAST